MEIDPGAVVLACVLLEAGVPIGSLASVCAHPDLGTFNSVRAGARIGEGCHLGGSSALVMNTELADRLIAGT